MISFAINKLSPINRRQSDQLSVRLKWHPYLRLGTYSPPSRRRITFRCKRRRFVLDATDVRSNVELHPRQIHVDHTSGYFNARDDKTTHINIRRRRRTATNDCCVLSGSVILRLSARPTAAAAAVLVYLLACGERVTPRVLLRSTHRLWSTEWWWPLHQNIGFRHVYGQLSESSVQCRQFNRCSGKV